MKGIYLYDLDLKGLKRHELAHSYNTYESPLWNPTQKEEYYADKPLSPHYESKEGDKWPWSNMGPFSGHGSLENVYKDLFGAHNFKNYSGHALHPAEISSAKAYTEGLLKDKGIWDYNKSAFSSSNLDAMLNTNFSNDVTGAEEKQHLKDMGYTGLEGDMRQIRRFNTLTDDMQYNVARKDQYNLGWDYDKSSENDAMDEFNSQWKADNRKKYQFGEFEARQIIKNSERKKGKKYEKALEYINAFDKIQSDQRQIQVDDYKNQMQNFIDKDRSEVERKLGIYFNELVQNEEISDDLPVQMEAKYGGEPINDSFYSRDKYTSNASKYRRA